MKFSIIFVLLMSIAAVAFGNFRPTPKRDHVPCDCDCCARDCSFNEDNRVTPGSGRIDTYAR